MFEEKEPLPTFEPWQKYAALTSERLVAVADMIRQVRHGALADHHPSLGDTNWGLGCKSYERTCFGFRQLASRNSDWLAILPETRALRFSFAIGEIPFRFYTGTADDDPPDRYCSRTFGELHHQQLCLELDGFTPLDSVLRIAVEPDPVTREVMAVTVVEVDGSGKSVHGFAIPAQQAQASKVTVMQHRAVELAPPQIEPLSKIEDVAKANGTTEEKRATANTTTE